MVWWSWVVIGLALMMLELAFIDAAFYLVFVGVAALATGIIGFVGTALPAWALPVWLQWLTFSVAAILATVLFRQKLYTLMRGDPIGFEDQVDGRHVDVLEPVDAGEQTRVEFRGSRWTAVNVSDRALKAGEQAVIVRAEGSLLEVRGLDADAASEPA